MPRKTIYRWKEGSSFGGDAQEVGEYLDRLKRKNKGHLRTEDVFEAAKDPSAPIHRYFEWDGEKAIEKYGRYIARQLSASLETEVVVTGEKKEAVRAFVNVVAGGDQYYTTMPEAMSDAEAAEYLVRKVTRQLVKIREEYAQVGRLAKVYAAIDEARIEVLHGEFEMAA